VSGVGSLQSAPSATPLVRFHELFTERELDVMAVLWELGSGTVADVKVRLADPLAYTTVLTVLRTLEEKGNVGHEEEGRAYRYFPRVDRDHAQESALRRLVEKLFSGSTELLLPVQDLEGRLHLAVPSQSDAVPAPSRGPVPQGSGRRKGPGPPAAGEEETTRRGPREGGRLQE